MPTLSLPHVPLRSLALAAVLLACSIRAHAVEPPTPYPWRDARQLVLVLTDDWNATTGTLQRFELRDGHWRADAAAAPTRPGRRSIAGSAFAAWLGTRFMSAERSDRRATPM